MHNLYIRAFLFFFFQWIIPKCKKIPIPEIIVMSCFAPWTKDLLICKIRIILALMNEFITIVTSMFINFLDCNYGTSINKQYLNTLILLRPIIWNTRVLLVWQLGQMQHKIYMHCPCLNKKIPNAVWLTVQGKQAIRPPLFGGPPHLSPSLSHPFTVGPVRSNFTWAHPFPITKDHLHGSSTDMKL